MRATTAGAARAPDTRASIEPESPSRRERNKQRTRARILSAATAMFAERGVAASGVDDLAAAADVARGTLFNYFPSKSAIVAAILDNQSQQYHALIEAQRQKDIPTAGKLSNVFKSAAREIQKAPGFFKLIMGDAGLSWNGPGPAADRVTHLLADMRLLLESGIARGDVRADLPAALLAEMTLGTFLTILRSWQFETDYDLPTRLAGAARLLSEAMAPR